MLPAISVENLGKAYRIGVKQEMPDTFMGMLSSIAKAPFRNFRELSSLDTVRADAAKEQAGIVWALKDVSFEVQHGEVLGIIGHNGAGKSTLLKILSRITEPTKGRAVINGRVASLLEVGTGFHPELSGRDNIYMNGTILGMSKREIDRKLDEIVGFSGVEKFLDTPIKRYSSGMKVRLAFAVAAHLEPEILVIDEVLAVGDQEFQNKCMGKMGEVAKGGRTVLFVSHNMAAVEVLCSTCILLAGGTVRISSDPQTAIASYLVRRSGAQDTGDLRTHIGRSKQFQFPILNQLRILDARNLSLGQVRQGEACRFEIDVHPHGPIRSARLAVRIFDATGVRITTLHTEYQSPKTYTFAAPTRFKCTMEDCRLAPGKYNVDLQLDDGRDCIDRVEGAAAFEVMAADIYGTGKLFPNRTALFLPQVQWDANALDSSGSKQGIG